MSKIFSHVKHSIFTNWKNLDNSISGSESLKPEKDPESSVFKNSFPILNQRIHASEPESKSKDQIQNDINYVGDSKVESNDKVAFNQEDSHRVKDNVLADNKDIDKTSQQISSTSNLDKNSEQLQKVVDISDDDSIGDDTSFKESDDRTEGRAYNEEGEVEGDVEKEILKTAESQGKLMLK